MRWIQRRRCPHVDVRAIYGDEIIFGTPKWNRLQCRDCGRFLDGPVSIAVDRQRLLAAPSTPSTEEETNHA